MPLHPSVPRKSLHSGRGGAAVQRREDVHAFQTPKGFLERSGPGDPLPAGVKQRMERYFGADFSDVRVHVGNEARSIGALAFTLGSDIYFAPEHYRPGTRAGQELLGHELTHVVQQREGRVANPFGDGVAVVQDFELEAEADRHGKAAAQGLRGPGPGLEPHARPGANTSGVQAKGYKLVVGAYMHEGRLPDEVAGHSFVAIEDPSGERRAFGFSPAHYGSYDPRRDMGRLKAGVAGVVHDDAGAFDKPGVKTQAYSISPQQADAALTKVAEYESGRHRYSADRQQCSTFALDVMRAARVKGPNAGPAPRPRAMYEALASAQRKPHPSMRSGGIQRAKKPDLDPARKVKRVGPPSAFLVDDAETPGEGQVRKSTFLAALRSKVTAIAARVLAPAGRTVLGCPYIPYWFMYYEGRNAQQVEQAITRYAPEAGVAKSWRDYVDRVAERVEAGFEANVESGSLAGVPAGIPLDLETTLVVQRKALGGTIQRCGKDKTPEQLVSERIEKEQKDQRKRLEKWRRVVPLNENREIVFRKLSKVKALDLGRDEARHEITLLNFEQNEALEGISLSRNPKFVADAITTGRMKGVYACALPARGGYDLERAYLEWLGGLPVEYSDEKFSSKLSQEITAETVPRDCVIGWVLRDEKEAVKYYHNDQLDKSIDYKSLKTYDRFLAWVQIIKKAGGDLTGLPKD